MGRYDEDKRVEADLFTDRFGNEIRVGDFIVYGNSAGRGAKTAVGKVVTIYASPARWYNSKEGDLDYAMRVCSIQDDMHGSPNAKNVTLTRTQRVLKFAPEFLSHEIRDILAKGELKGKCKCGHKKSDHWSGGHCYQYPNNDCPCQKYEPE